eukprot:scaffold368_cov258-Pinguiococcus_pyrenoidosus.AAC.36
MSGDACCKRAQRLQLLLPLRMPWITHDLRSEFGHGPVSSLWKRGASRRANPTDMRPPGAIMSIDAVTLCSVVSAVVLTDLSVPGSGQLVVTALEDGCAARHVRNSIVARLKACSFQALVRLLHRLLLHVYAHEQRGVHVAEELIGDEERVRSLAAREV